MNPSWSVPFNKPRYGARGLAYVMEAVRRGNLAGPGAFTQACEKLMTQKLRSSSSFIVPSCTAALEMSALLIDLNPGDEVIMPSFTFVSTANAVVLRGACPVFVDVDSVTLNMDPAQAEAAVTPRTKAIYVVHYAGVPADMEAINKLASQHGLCVVEDAAQAYGSFRDGKAAGSFAPISCFSFHGTKNISAGEAGALVLNGMQYQERAAIIREKGTDRIRFQRGEVDAYTWVDLGGSHIVNELTAAFLAAQVEDEEAIQEQRLTVWNRYRESLSPLAREGHFAIPSPPGSVRHNAHIFFLILNDRASRDSLKEHLACDGIQAFTHYEPLHLSLAGRRFGRQSGQLKQTDRATTCLLRLPLYPDLLPQQDRVTDSITAWCLQG